MEDGGLFIICLPLLDRASTILLILIVIVDAYTIINELGTGALLSKIDLKNAFRLIPVRQADWNLLGIHWKDKYYIDTCLPFGLRSAPFLFNQLADAIHWILHQQYGVHHLLHYLDDFLTAGPPNSNTCQLGLSLFCFSNCLLCF